MLLLAVNSDVTTSSLLNTINYVSPVVDEWARATSYNITTTDITIGVSTIDLVNESITGTDGNIISTTTSTTTVGDASVDVVTARSIGSVSDASVNVVTARTDVVTVV